MKRTCVICDKIYEGRSNGKTCSPQCRRKYEKEYSRTYLKEYYKDIKNREKARKATRKWWRKNRGGREWKRDAICVICGEQFIKPRWNQKACSKECSKKLNKKTAMEYRNIYRINYTDEQISKFEYLVKEQQYMGDYDRSGPCYVCETIDIKRLIHHIKYNPVEVVLLCTKCHGCLHHKFLNGKKVAPR